MKRHLSNKEELQLELIEVNNHQYIESDNKKEQQLAKTKQTEFGGTPGAVLLMVFAIINSYLLLIACNKNQCSFQQLPNLQPYTLLSSYYDPIAYIGFLAYATLLALISIIPFGGKMVEGLPTKSGRFIYIINGLFSFVLITAIGVGFELYGIQISKFTTQHLIPLLTISALFGCGLALYAYIRSFFVPRHALNVQAIGASPISAFFIGREISPRIFGSLDLKIYVNRLALLGPQLLDFAFLYQSITVNLENTENITWSDYLSFCNFNPSLILLVILHSSYLIIGLLLEDTWVTSYEIQYEGFGFISGYGYSMYPFMLVSVTKYVVDFNIRLSIWHLTLTGFVFLIGAIFYAGSNIQKDTFRKNSNDPAVAHLETISTATGKKLICSSFWGFVRHPNYLGDILMNLSFAPFCWNVPPIITVLIVVFFLSYRTVRDQKSCQEKYGSSWNKYCSKVKYILIPKIY